jgi:hypothetical protein
MFPPRCTAAIADVAARGHEGVTRAVCLYACAACCLARLGIACGSARICEWEIEVRILSDGQYLRVLGVSFTHWLAHPLGGEEVVWRQSKANRTVTCHWTIHQVFSR